MEINFNQAVKIIRNGGIIIYPTDTAFGIGCRIDDDQAVSKLFKIRKRAATKAVPVLVGSIKMALKYILNPQPYVIKYMYDYWPGALTIVSKCNIKLITKAVRGGGNSIGLRMPDHQIPLRIINEIDVPIIGTSANFSGYPTPFTFNSVDQDLINLSDGIIKGVCQFKQASTVVDCTADKFIVIRQGGIKITNLI